MKKVSLDEFIRKLEQEDDPYVLTASIGPVEIEGYLDLTDKWGVFCLSADELEKATERLMATLKEEKEQ